MPDLSSYRIQDFLLFSKETYFDLFKTYNQKIWPMQVLWILISVVIVLYAVKKKFQSLIWFAVAGAWFYVGWFFHAQEFSVINWSATYFAYAFKAQGILLILMSRALRFTENLTVGISIFCFAAFVPVMIFFGQTNDQVQLFGWGADATALGTIGLLLATSGGARVLPMIIPVGWIIIAALTYFGMKPA